MATVIEKPDPAPRFAAKVDEQLAEATSRIRGHDLALGGLLVGGLVLGYATGMMLLDRYLVLPDWLRQAALVGFLGVTGLVAFRTLVRPLRQRVNPLYAAVVVERTIEDAKNSVVGYVEAQDRGDVHPAVKAAMGARAAKTVDEADVNRAVDHRSLVYAGAAVVALFLTLVVLFFLFRPTQFQSLLGRAFAPFASGVIASRTTITLIEPQGGDVTVTSGHSITVKVEVTGSVPKPDRADKMRLLVRYNPAAAEYDELPLEPGETSRDWFVVLRPEHYRTGAWYKVAGGDAESAEYRITTRTAPLFTDFEVEYQFPAYTLRPADRSTDPHLQAIRNTTVSVVAKANRQVREGRAAFEPPGQPPVTGKAVPGRPDALRFDFLLTTPGSYRLTFTSADGERSADSPPFGLKVDDDFAPTVEVLRPEPEEIPLPANGLLGVDAVAGDDYGLDKLTLKLKLAAPLDRPLADRPYLGGKSFRREADGTFPRSLEYKDSVELGKLTDPAGGKVELKADMVIEYWLEATDNRTKPGVAGPEPDPNVGKSKVKRVRLTPPVEEPEHKQQQDERRDQRKQEEQQHARDQQKRLDREDRGPQQPDQKVQPQDNQDHKAANPPMPMTGQHDMGKSGPQPMPPEMGKMPPDKGMGNDGMGMKQEGMGNPPPMKGGDPKMPPQDGMNNNPMPPQDAKGGMTKDGMGMPSGMPQTDMMGGKGDNPQQAPMPSDPGRKDVQDQASRVKDQLNQEMQGGGSPKSAPTAKDDERTNSADQKANPPTGGMPPESPPKAGDGGMGASEPRPQGKVEPPQDPASTKPGPMSDMNPGGPKSADQRPSEKRSEPLGSNPGEERPTPMGGDPMPRPMPEMGDPMMGKGGMPQGKNDPKAGGDAKPATQQKSDGDTMGDPMMGKTRPQPNAAENAGRAKTAPPSNDPGGERDPQPAAGPKQGGDPKAERPEEPGSVRPKAGDPMMDPGGKGNNPKAGDPMNAAEPRTSPKSADPKSADPKSADPMPGTPKMGEPMPGTPMTGNPKDGPKGSDTKGGMPQQKGVEPGAERPMPGEMEPGGARPEAPMPKSVDPMPGGKHADPTMGNPMTSPKAGPEAGPMSPMTPKAGGNDNPMPASKGGPPPKLDAKQKAELEQAAKDLTSPDQAKRKDAHDKLDRALGKEGRQEIEDIANGLNSDDPAEKERARQRLDDLRRRAEEATGKEPPKDGQPMPMPGMGDPKVGPMEDMNPNQKTNQKGGTGDGPKGGPTPKFDPKELEKDLQNLNSKDEAKQKEARDRLDKTVGEKARREAEKLQNDLSSDDPERQARAREKLDELRRQAEQMAKNNPPGKGGNEDERWNPGPGSVTPKNGPPMADDPRNRAKSAELTLDQFERNRHNRDLQDRLGWTQEQYDRFLEDYRREVERLRRDAADAERAPAPPPGPPTRPDNINGGGRIDGGPAAGPSSAGVGGPAFAAPGYSDALRRFQQGATQRPQPKRP